MIYDRTDACYAVLHLMQKRPGTFGVNILLSTNWSATLKVSDVLMSISDISCSLAGSKRVRNVNNDGVSRFGYLSLNTSLRGHHIGVSGVNSHSLTTEPFS